MDRDMDGQREGQADGRGTGRTDGTAGSYVSGQVEVVRRSRVHVDGVEAGAGPVDDLEPLALLHGQVHQQGPVGEVPEGLGSGGRG